VRKDLVVLAVFLAWAAAIPLGAGMQGVDEPEYYLPRYASDGSFLFLWHRDLQFGWLPLVQDWTAVRTDELYILGYTPVRGLDTLPVNVTIFHGWRNRTSYGWAESRIYNLTGVEWRMVGQKIVLPSSFNATVVWIHYLDCEFWFWHQTSLAYLMTLPKPLLVVVAEYIQFAVLFFLDMMACMFVTRQLLRRVLYFPRFDPLVQLLPIGFIAFTAMIWWAASFESFVLSVVPFILGSLSVLFIWFGLQMLGEPPRRWLLWTIPSQRVRRGQQKGALATWEVDVARRRVGGGWKWCLVGGVKRALLNLLGRYQEVEFDQPPEWYWTDPDGNYDRVYLVRMGRQPVIRDFTVHIPSSMFIWLPCLVGSIWLVAYSFQQQVVELIWGSIAVAAIVAGAGVYLYGLREVRFGIERSKVYVPLESIHGADITKWWASEKYREDTVRRLDDLTDKLVAAEAEKTSLAFATAYRYFHLFHALVAQRLGTGDEKDEQILEKALGLARRQEDSQPEGAGGRAGEAEGGS